MSGPRPNRRLFALWLLPFLLAACAASPGPRPTNLSTEVLFGLTLPRSGGGQLRLDQCRGQLMMIDFFATWNQASQAAVPAYAVLDQKYGSKGLCIIGVAMDDLGDQVVAPFVAGMGIPYPVALADKALLEGHSVFGPLDAIPTTMLFDRQGRLIKVFIGLVPIEQFDQIIRRFL